MARLLKMLHELGSIGTLGAVAACLILLKINQGEPASAAVAASGHVAQVIQYLLMPSFVAVLLSGLLAIAATPSYMNAGWAWFKALLGLSLFEASLALSATSREAANLSLQAAASQDALAQLGRTVRSETGLLWALFGISVINVVLGVWRPRLVRLRKAAAERDFSPPT